MAAQPKGADSFDTDQSHTTPISYFCQGQCLIVTTHGHVYPQLLWFTYIVALTDSDTL